MKKTKQKAATSGPVPMTEGEVAELVDTMLRDALREQARHLEQHLQDIHARLITLEKQ
jgi:hypothetical protein